MVLEVSRPPDNKTVERAHRSPLFQQTVDEVAPYEASSARYQVDPHLRCRYPCCLGDLMGSKATNFKLRASLAKGRIPQVPLGRWRGASWDRIKSGALTSKAGRA